MDLYVLPPPSLTNGIKEKYMEHVHTYVYTTVPPSPFLYCTSDLIEFTRRTNKMYHKFSETEMWPPFISISSTKNHN